MQAGMMCQRLVFTVPPDADVTRAAGLMREKHVGFLVVVDPDRPSGGPRPVGVLTDRDIVVSIVARAIDPSTVRVGDIMTLNPITAQEFDSIELALQKMRQFGVRRLPILNARGELAGILALDDVLKYVSGETEDILAAMRTERQVEAAARP